MSGLPVGWELALTISIFTVLLAVWAAYRDWRKNTGTRSRVIPFMMGVILVILIAVLAWVSVGHNQNEASIKELELKVTVLQTQTERDRELLLFLQSRIESCPAGYLPTVVHIHDKVLYTCEKT